MSRWSYLSHRLLYVIPVLFGVTLISFLVLQLVPGDPTAIMLGTHYTPQRSAELRHELGLDRSLWHQYWTFVWGLFHGDLGTSIYYKQPVMGLIGQRLPVTLWLSVEATLLSIAISVPVAAVSALRRNGLFDQSARVLLTFTYSMPPFWLGLMLILVFGLKLNVFPVAGYGDGPLEHVYYLFLPALTVGIFFSTILVRTLRNSILDILTADYIDVAWAKGLTPARTFLKHVLRNALMPGVSVIGVNLALLIGSTVIVETVFALPGLGQLLVFSVNGRDLTVVQAIVLVFGFIVVLVNILTDLCYTLLDPRVALER